MTRIRGRKLQEIRSRFLAKHPLCSRCSAQGFITAAVEVDHVIPLFKGGADEDQNRQALCKPCHLDKTREDMGFARVNGCDVNGDPGPSWQ